MVGLGDQPRRQHGIERLPRVGMLHAGMLFAVLEPEHLHDELDVNDAAVAALQVATTAAGLDAFAHRLDIRGKAWLPLEIIDGAAERLGYRPTELGIAADDAAARQRLTFPKLSAAAVVIAIELAEGNNQA